MSRRVIARCMVAASSLMTAILSVYVIGASEAFLSPSVTAIAAMALLLSLPLVDSAMGGSSVSPGVAGICAGMPIGFFMRQAELSPALASGAGRILGVAFAVSLALLVRRLWTRRRQSA